VYDALNVLEAIGMITKNKKAIQWRGWPSVRPPYPACLCSQQKHCRHLICCSAVWYAHVGWHAGQRSAALDCRRTLPEAAEKVAACQTSQVPHLVGLACLATWQLACLARGGPQLA